MSYLRPALIAPLVCLLYCVYLIGAFGNPLALVTLGARYAPPELQPYSYSDEGYDGQSVYLIARYGFEGAPYIDVPAYRYQRILLPAMGGALALGQVAILPYTLLAVNLLAVAAGTFFLGRLLREDFRVSRWYAVGFAFSIGVIGAARLTTTEALAYGLVVMGIYAMQRDRWLWGALAFALAALSKEPALVFPFAYGLLLLYELKIPRALIFGAIALLPFLIWQGVLYAQFGEFGIGSGGEGATGFEIIPFMGFLRILLVGGAEVFFAIGLFVGIFVIVPTLWALWRCWRDFRAQTWTFWTLLLFINAALMLFVPFSTYREILGILRFIVGLQIAVILYAASKRQQRPLLYSTLWFLTIALVIFSDVGMLGE